MEEQALLSEQKPGVNDEAVECPECILARFL